MIKLRLSFGKDQSEKSFDIVKDELLQSAVDRALEGVPLGTFKQSDAFVVLVNGNEITPEFWAYTQLTTDDQVLIAPKIGKGDAGQIFKQALILTVAIVASVYFPPASYGVWGALAVAGATIGATLLFNALIPPPVPKLGEGGFNGRVDDSQMYSISGQSNQMRRLGIVPKVYGNHRMFPNLACTPYTELAVDRGTGQTVQYLYAIYDFGLGVMQVSELKIGDTPLTTDSFEDFEYRFVDPNKPTTDEDDFDAALESDFKFYRSRRVSESLSVALTNGNENIQFSDANADLNPQEIILDFVCPRGLFGYSSRGQLGNRSVKLQIDFALVGTTDWRPYNDPDFVDGYKAVGGTDVTDFTARFYPFSENDSIYYVSHSYSYRNSNGDRNSWKQFYIRPNQRKLVVYDDSRYEVGAKIVYGNRFLGKIQSISNLGGDATELTLDRNITTRWDIQAYNNRGYRQYNSPTVVWEGSFNLNTFVTSRHESSAAVITAARTTPVYAQFRFTPSTPGQYQVRVRRVTTTGSFTTQTADDVTWGGITTSIKTPPVQTTRRHCFLELRIKATNQLNGHIQNLSGEVSSVLPVYDPDTDTWTREVTNNPAWVFCDLLTGEVNKKAVSTDRLHLDSIVEWAEYCDEVPTPPPGGTYLEPRFRTDFILDYEINLQGILNQVTGTAQASLNIIDGKYGVLIDRFKETPVQIFTPRNSRDFTSTRMYALQPHGVKVKYIDPNLNWEVSEAIVYDDGYDETTATDFDELTAFACTNYEQAWRFGRYMIAQNKLRQETINILVDFEHLVCTRGDYVQISQDVMRVGGRPARVKDVSGSVITTDDSLDIDPLLSYGYTYRKTSDGEILTSTLTPLTPNTFDVDGDAPAIGDLIVIGEVGSIVYDCIVKSISPNDDLSASLVLVEKADAIYDYESTGTLPEYDPQLSGTSRPDFSPPLAVINLEVADNAWTCSDTKSGYTYYVDLIWDVPPGSVYEFFEIWVDDGTGYRAVDRTTDKLYTYIVNQDYLDQEHGFKVVAVSASGKKIELIAMPEVTATPEAKTTPPSDVAALNMSITNQVIQLSWNSIEDCDVFEYELRFSPEGNDVWESSIPLAKVSKNVNSVSVQARTGVYLIKAIDFGLNQSASAARAVTTIPNLFDLNIIETMNEAPTFPGVKDQVEPLGEALILEEAVPGDEDTVQYAEEGYYEFSDLLDLDEIYSVRLQSQIRADGLKKGELMSEWESLEELESLNSALSSEWDVALQYRATDVFAAMSSWVSLDTVDQLNFGAGVGFTEWRDIPTVGDATGRIFQFRIKLESLAANVTPRLFDATVKADMPDRIDSFENLTSDASEATEVNFDPVFKGPGTSPNIQISIDGAQTGDYWTFDYRTLEGFAIRFYDNNDNQVVRQFDVVAKGYGRRHTSSL